MREAGMRGELNRSIRVCVDSYAQGEMKGRCFNPGLENGNSTFHSLSQLLVSVEDLMNEANYPQSYTARRSFHPLSEQTSAAAPGDPGGSGLGEKATFVVRILFRQHASWQGTVTWLEGKGEQTFRSALELVLLMDGALGGCQTA